MPTFQALREKVITIAKTEDHFNFIELSIEHGCFWERINIEEYRRGYSEDKYKKPDSPALWEMDLITKYELGLWMEDFNKMHNNYLSAKNRNSQ